MSDEKVSIPQYGSAYEPQMMWLELPCYACRCSFFAAIKCGDPKPVLCNRCRHA